MRSMFLTIGAIILIASTGCHNSSSSSGAADEEVLELTYTEIDLPPGKSKDVRLKSGKANKVEGPAADTGVTAKFAGNKVHVVAAEDAKEGTHTVKVSGGKNEVELKVNVGNKDK
jgi:hypothetical protein